ncbi:hypothetical protein TorRG33x02_227290, partial [Trema orientale]
LEEHLPQSGVSACYLSNVTLIPIEFSFRISLVKEVMGSNPGNATLGNESTQSQIHYANPIGMRQIADGPTGLRKIFF